LLDLVVIGHIAKDVIIREGSRTRSIGGAPFYAGIAARKMGGNVGIVSKVGRDLDDEALSIFEEVGIEASIRRTDGLTTCFELEYLSGGRRLRLRERCEPILFEDVPKNFLEADSLLISPIAREISPDFVKRISRETDSPVAIDLQGFVRRFDDSGNVFFDTWREGEHVLPSVNIVKCSKREAVAATGCDDIYEAAQEILNFGPEIVIVTLGEEGVLIRGKENFYIPPKTRPEKVVETTGAGDIFFGVFLLEYVLTGDVKISGHTAVFVAARSVERKGMDRFITREMLGR